MMCERNVAAGNNLSHSTFFRLELLALRRRWLSERLEIVAMHVIDIDGLERFAAVCVIGNTRQLQIGQHEAALTAYVIDIDIQGDFGSRHEGEVKQNALLRERGECHPECSLFLDMRRNDASSEQVPLRCNSLVIRNAVHASNMAALRLQVGAIPLHRVQIRHDFGDVDSAAVHAAIEEFAASRGAIDQHTGPAGADVPPLP